MPDIDLDFEDERRDEVVRYVLDKYGANHAAQIGTLATFGQKRRCVTSRGRSG